MGWIFMHMTCALDTLANFFTSLYCWHSTDDMTIPSSQAQHRKITTWNYEVILMYVNAPEKWMQNMGKTNNKFLGTILIAIYNTNSELCYANNCQHIHTVVNHMKANFVISWSYSVWESPWMYPLSLYIGNHITWISQSPPAMFAKVKEMERKYCLENPPVLAGTNNHLL